MCVCVYWERKEHLLLFLCFLSFCLVVFLYSTSLSIDWHCEKDRTEERLHTHRH